MLEHLRKRFHPEEKTQLEDAPIPPLQLQQIGQFAEAAATHMVGNFLDERLTLQTCIEILASHRVQEAPKTKARVSLHSRRDQIPLWEVIPQLGETITLDIQRAQIRMALFPYFQYKVFASQDTYCLVMQDRHHPEQTYTAVFQQTSPNKAITVLNEAIVKVKPTKTGNLPVLASVARTAIQKAHPAEPQSSKRRE